MVAKPVKQLNKLIDKDLEDKYFKMLMCTSDEIINKLKNSPSYYRDDDFTSIFNLLCKQQDMIKYLSTRIK